MKTLLKKNQKLFLTIVIVLLLIALASITILIRSSLQQTDSTNKDPSQQETKTTQLDEVNIHKTNTSIDEVIRNYMNKTYPEGENMTIQIELVGKGYGITNITYSINEQSNTRKIYLKGTDDSWSVIHEDTDQISCSEVRELIGTETILSSYCTE